MTHYPSSADSPAPDPSSADSPAPAATGLRSPRTVFRVIAIAEAFSWAGLLIGMLFKYVLSDNEIGVQVFGSIHGAIFLAYVAACVLLRNRFGWSLAVTAVALAASIPPFTTYAFEVWADRTGRLTDVRRNAAAPEPA